MGKQNLYDHSLHVPLIMSGPGIPQNKRCDAFCYLLDIYPTLCDLIEVEIPGTVEGQSLLPTMARNERVRDHLLFAYKNVQRAVQDRQFKLVEYVVDGRRATQLFNLQADPWELANLAGSPAFAGHIESLRQKLREWPEMWGDTQPGQGQVFWSDFDRQEPIPGSRI